MFPPNDVTLCETTRSVTAIYFPAASCQGMLTAIRNRFEPATDLSTSVLS